MIRQFLPDNAFKEKSGFIWRGHDVSRIESFSDAVFAFSITILIVALEVPQTFAELKNVLFGFIGFAFSFALICYIWYCHYRYFRRYGLHSGIIFFYNSVLLFFVLFYIFLLKFLSGYLQNIFSGGNGLVTDSSGGKIVIMNMQEGQDLMVIYSVGFMAIFFVLVLMHVYAYKKRNDLNMTQTEVLLTVATIIEHSIMVLTGFISIVITKVTGNAGLGGMIYGILIGPLQFLNGYIMGRKINAALKRAEEMPQSVENV